MLATTQDASEYRKNFRNYYYEKIKSKLESYELIRIDEQKKQHFWYGLMGLFLTLTLFVFFCDSIIPNLYVHPEIKKWISIIMGALASGCYIMTKRISKDFENGLKEGVIDIFLKFFGDFSWSCFDSINEADVVESQLVDGFNRFYTDDYFEGSHKGVKVKISELHLRHVSGSGKNRRDVQIFKGIFVQLGMNKKFKYQTIVTEDSPLRTFFKTKFSSMESVELEDPEFNKMFDVFSQDQVEARFLLTTSFMERFKNLKNTYKTDDIRASFLDDKITIAIPSNRDMFKLGCLNKSITDSGQVTKLFEEFVAVLSLIDLLKLTMKTGL